MTRAELAEQAERRELADGGEQYRHNQYGDSRERSHMPRDSHRGEFAGGGIQMSVIAQTFPVSADDVRGPTGIRRDQVAGSHRSGQIARFGQVCTVLTHRRENRVTAGGGSRPGGDRAVTRFESERIFGVDAPNLWPRDLDGAKNVAYGHSSSGHDNRRATERGPREQSDESEDGQQLQGIQPATLNNRQRDRGCARGEDDNRKYAPESRVQGEVWRHRTMFPRTHRIQGERRTS